jgi:lysylphosphatidylglycerol synthetase-like protein (DUF2156 family)
MSAVLEAPAVTASGDATLIDHPSGFLAVSSRNERFADGAGEGFIAYREQGRHLVALGGVHAPAHRQGALLDAFVAFAATRRRRPLFVQVREPQVSLLCSHGFTVNQLGSSFTLTLAGFSLRGTSKMRLRNKLARARHARLRVVELGREAERDAASFERLRAISAAWLGDKGKKELDFMIGELGDVDDTRRRIFATLDAGGAMLGFITYVPAWGARPGYLHDLTRRAPEAPPGTMELCNATAIERFTAEGVAFLHFGFTPFVVGEHEPPGANRVAAWAVRQLYRHGRLVYPAESQAQYKLKWGPDVLEREYLAARPLSLRAVLDLLILTRSI